jgi:hypothetical protein
VSPQQPAIIFPNGSETAPGGTLTVTFAASGDKGVTKFRYSLDSPALDRTAEPVTPGGSVTVTLDVGTTTGPRPIYAVAVDRRNRTSDLTQAEIIVTPTTQLDGTVLSLSTWLPVEGATVTLEPGGRQTTTDANGFYSFSGVGPGVYTVTATLGGDCPSAGSQTVEIDGQGLTLELYLLPTGTCG